MMDYLLALDQGTTSSRAIAFDRAGGAIAIAQQAFSQHFPQPGLVEHDTIEIWSSQLRVAREVIAETGRLPTAIGITNQRETTVLWDRATGQPIAPAIVWQDRRTVAHCERLRECGQHTEIEAKTGLVLDAYFSATKLAWLLEHVPGARARAANGELAFGTIDSWLIWQLTGGKLHVTDASNASRTMLMDLATGQWDPELLATFDIPRSVLPEIVPSSGVIGETDVSIFGQAIPIAGIAGDQQAATFGQACLTRGQAKNTYGTGCFLLMNAGDTPRTSHNRLIGTLGWKIGSRTTYCLEGSVFMAGATVQWLRDGLGLISRADEIEALATSVADTGDLWLVPAFTGLGAPDWDGRARGLMIGMTRGSTRAHIARAALESIALQSADLITAMNADAGAPITELRVDGGATRNDALMQMQADFSGIPVLRPTMTETTAFGAAALAGLATGFWSGLDEVAACWRLDRRFEPVWDAGRRDTHRARWREAVERARGWARD
jgi:glycerol kinase